MTCNYSKGGVFPTLENWREVPEREFIFRGFEGLVFSDESRKLSFLFESVINLCI